MLPTPGKGNHSLLARPSQDAKKLRGSSPSCTTSYELRAARKGGAYVYQTACCISDTAGRIESAVVPFQCRPLVLARGEKRKIQRSRIAVCTPETPRLSARSTSKFLSWDDYGCFLPPLFEPDIHTVRNNLTAIRSSRSYVSVQSERATANCLKESNEHSISKHFPPVSLHDRI